MISIVKLRITEPLKPLILNGVKPISSLSVQNKTPVAEPGDHVSQSIKVPLPLLSVLKELRKGVIDFMLYWKTLYCM